MDDTQDERRYEVGRQAVPGLLGQSLKREKRWAAVAGVCLLYALGAEWRHSTQLAKAKTAAGAPRVLVAKCDGFGEDARLVSADEWRLTDGMVFERLDRVTKCMRGLSGTAAEVRECWEQITPMFRGEAAKRFSDDARKVLGTTASELQQRLQNERVRVERLTGSSKPSPDRFWTHWQESGKRNGKAIDEAWNGVWTVQLVPMTDESGGLVITDYTLERDQ